MNIAVVWRVVASTDPILLRSNDASLSRVEFVGLHQDTVNLCKRRSCDLIASERDCVLSARTFAATRPAIDFGLRGSDEGSRVISRCDTSRRSIFDDATDSERSRSPPRAVMSKTEVVSRTAIAASRLGDQSAHRRAELGRGSWSTRRDSRLILTKEPVCPVGRAVGRCPDSGLGLDRRPGVGRRVVVHNRHYTTP